MTAIAARPIAINEEFVLGHYPPVESAKKILSLLSMRSHTTKELAKRMGLSPRYMHFVLGTVGYLGFIDKYRGESGNQYHLTEVGEELHGLKDDAWESMWGASIASSSAAYLMVTEGTESVISFMEQRYGVTKSNAVVMAREVSHLLRYTSEEQVLSHGHPSLRDEKWSDLYISHGDRNAPKAEEKLSFCPTHFVSLPATGICEDCI